LSSILKALKKLEEESPPPPSHPSLPQTFGAKKPDGTKTRKRWYAQRLTAAFLILLVIVIAVVVVFSQGQLLIAKLFPGFVSEKKKASVTPPPQESNIYRAKISSPATKSAAKLTKQNAKRSARETQSVTNLKKSQNKTRPATPKRGIDRRNSKTQTAGRAPHSNAVARYSEPQKQKAPVPKVSVAKKSTSGNQKALNKPMIQAKKPNTLKTYDRINDPKLKLQALAWFKDASKRMVVINGRIVREGGSVDGYQITQIRQEDVVVNDGRKRWSLEFRLKPQ
jgi:cytoskeletal protein RodZ